MCTMFFKFFLISAIFTIAVAGTQNCFYCNSTEHANCADPFDSDVGNQVICNDLDYSSDPSTRGSGKVMLKNTAMAGIFNKMREGEKRTNVNFQDFRCLKLSLRVSGNEHLIRTCAPIIPTIKKSCDYIKQELDGDGYKVLNCHESEGDNSNGAVNLQLPSFIAMIISAVMLKF